MSQSTAILIEREPDGVFQRSSGPIRWARFGAPDGIPLLMLHGTPGSRLKFSAAHAPGLSHGVDVIAPDRWGYGGTHLPHRENWSLDAFADTMAQFMSGLGYNRFAVAGMSGGGPYALGLAARLGDRVTSLSLISPVGLVTDPSVPMTSFHRFCFGPLAKRPWAVRSVFAVYRRALGFAPGLACRVANARAPQVDKAIMADCGTSARLLKGFSEGLSAGASGPAVDLTVFRQVTRDLATRVACPARVVIGTADTNVPPAAAIALAKAIPGAHLDVIDGAGHLWAAQNYDDIIRWVANTASAQHTLS
ncbi:MAG: hypothetical protein RL291_387 [Pseudomonadota bacterium]